MVLLAGVLGAAGQSFSKRPLTSTSVRALIDNRTPDAAIAGEMRERGLGFVPTQDIVEEFRMRGAGPQTIAFLRNRIPQSTLAVNTGVPDCKIFLNENEVGITNSGGTLLLPNLPIGKYQVTIRNPRYFDHRETVTLPASGTTLRVGLDLAVGFLSMSTNADGGILSIQGYGSFPNEIRNLELPAGTYIVAARAPNYKDASQTVQIMAGNSTSAVIRMEPNVSDLVNAMFAGLNRGQTELAQKLAHNLLEFMPNNGYAYLALAETGYLTNNKEQFLDNARRTIQTGIQVPFEFVHIHNAKFQHPVLLNLGRNSLRIEYAYVSSCPLPQFTYLPKLLRVVKVEQKTGKQAVLQIEMYVPGHGLVKARFINAKQQPGAMSDLEEYESVRTLLLESRERTR